jgi:putative heme-binding domain-containing protein
MLLLADRDPKVRAMSKKLFADETTGSRADAYSRYKACLTLPVNMKSGEAIFVRECMTCHKLGPRGNMVGPNLSSIRRKTAEEVLLHVIDPNREVAPDFIEYNVSLRDGRTLSGLIASETANSVTLRRAEGVEETVLRTNIEAIASTGKSLMPEGMETRIKPQEMADLLAFLLELQK